MTLRHSRDTHLWQKLRDSGTVGDLLDVVSSIADEASSGAVSRDYYEIMSAAYDSLREMTQENPETGRQLILEHLLPHLLDPIIQTDSDYLVSQLRKCLADWIYQYRDPERSKLRDQVLDLVCVRIRRPRPQNAIWLAVHIGYRRDDIIELLRKQVNRYRGNSGDIALNALAWLGMSPDDKQWVLSQLHPRAAKRWNHYLESALARLADPSSIDVVKASWLPPSRGLRIAPTYHELMPTFSLRVLTEIANRHHDNAQLQTHIWGLLTELLNRRPDLYENNIIFGSDVAPSCNSPDVIPELFRWLNPAKNDIRADGSARHIFYNRLLTCVRPDQLRGWQAPDLDEKLPLLRTDAFLDTVHVILAMTAEAYLKRSAWDVAFSMGRNEVLSAGWFRNGVLNEQSPFEQARILELLACFQHKHLPKEIVTWITEPFDPEQQGDKFRSNAELSLRDAAIEVARSAATTEAFVALLDFGLTFDGQVLVNSGQALTDVAEALLAQGNTLVISELVRVAVHGSEPRHRTAAISALYYLAESERVPTEHALRLERLIFDGQLRDYEHSLIVGLLGYVPDRPLGEGALSLIRLWAADPVDERSMRSLRTLAYKGYLINDLELLKSQLGLSLVDGRLGLTSSKPRDEVAEIIGLLYHLYPDKLTNIVTELLRTFGQRDWSNSSALIRMIVFHHRRDDSPVPDGIVAELLSLALRLQSHTMADTGIFKSIAIIAPDALADAAWQQAWKNWLPNARVALAEALGSAQYHRNASRRQASKLLRELSSDGQYGVRRAAYRSLAAQDTAIFVSAISSWASSPEMDLRKRTAESLVWFPKDQRLEDIFQGISERLRTDPEISVRETTDRSLSERRDLSWADLYLSKVLKAKSNRSVLLNWCYGKALVQLGDDQILARLQRESRSDSRPPHIRYWFEQIAEQLNKRWRDVTRKWPEPLDMTAGLVEFGTGTLISGHHEFKDVEYNIWRQLSDDRSYKSWGGNLVVRNRRLIAQLGGNTQEFTLRLADGREGRIMVTRHTYSGISSINFVGQSKYP